MVLRRNTNPRSAANKHRRQICVSTQYPAKLLNKEHSNNNIHLECLHPDTIWIGRNFLSNEECQAIIHYSERSGAFERKFHKATRTMAHRDCYEHLHFDERMAEALYQRMMMSNILPILQASSDHWSEPPEINIYKPCGCNPNVKVYKYEPGMWFGRHVDVSDEVRSVSQTAQTEITVLVYLSECKGGATKFYPTAGQEKGISFRPEIGTILFHVHGDRCVEHEGEKVLKGIKYVLRTDVVYDYVG